LLGLDARDVLDKRLFKARDRNRRSREPWLAIAEMAIEKNDLGFAAEVLSEALVEFPEDPDVNFGLARALSGSDPKNASLHLEAALKANPKHLPSLLFQADRLIDAEQYEAAEELIATVLTVNPDEPDAFAYRAVIAHLTNDPRGEVTFHDKALAGWSQNPRIDWLIGKKLSQHYRFKEGATYQRRSLALAPEFAPAQRQLAQDLLRLGSEVEGWQVAQAAHDVDSYSVETFNLLELRDELSKFVTLENEHFLVRMDGREALLYGQEVLDLLTRAKQTLCEKYGLELKERVTVEIFPEENDFAVRTFGMPAVSGFLGVCFGRVITANSPASRRENPSNWEAVLWHEFCHVVTLELTGNRIPRWLSEGISVYEELQAEPSWGQRMNPRYREFILEGNATPLSKLSSAFMNPPSGWHLQFAYFESALAVEFLIEKHGLEALRNVLQDLRVGMPINVALDRRCDELSQLEMEFDLFARKKASELAPEVDWSKPDAEALIAGGRATIEALLKDKPHNFTGLMLLADLQMKSGQWADAADTLKKLIALYPDYAGGDNAYEKLAGVARHLNDRVTEKHTLLAFAGVSADSVTSNLRLIELHSEDAEWEEVSKATTRLRAIDPLLKPAHEAAARSSEQLGRPEDVVAALQRLLVLEPDDPADVHYRLAVALHALNRNDEAKRQVLMALEEAPRYRDAHRLLLKLARSASK
jgi:tetratricopeptide (TPR) repeat protein